MAITLTSDPIVALSDVKELINEVNDTEAKVLINAVSEKFLRYTGRKRITQGSIVEWDKGGLTKIYLHGSPVDESSAVQVDVYNGTEIAVTMTVADEDLRIVQCATSAYLELVTYCPPWIEGIDTVKISYTGGWETVPGDIVLAAIDQMRIERNRMDGNLGALSMSANGETVRFETSGLIKAVQDAFEPYRMLV
jgi:hypothetical protein